MNDESLSALLHKIKDEFIQTMNIEVSSSKNEIILDVYFDKNVIEKIRTAIELSRLKNGAN